MTRGLSRRDFLGLCGVSLSGALVLAPLAGCSAGSSSGSSTASGSKLASVRSRGRLNAGVKKDVPGYGYFDPASGTYQGMEVDLCYQVAAAIFDVDYETARANDLVSFTDVTPKTRGPLIDNDQLDIVCATYTITDARKQSWDFSTPYRTDYVGLMVKKRAQMTKISELDGKIVGVSQGATTQSLVEQMLQDNAIDATPEFLAFSGYPLIKSSLDAGNIDCFAMDRSTLSGYMNDTVELLEPDVKFGEQSYGIATKKDSDLSATVDQAVQDCDASGWLADEIDAWGLV
ncbi:transporter substrate-binding domain-containing protein [Thermophilibacter immobilis]|jgi:putative glutamine transport system substrate-binding protein|uniref:Transporter substrate-binding domain-containing protein n=1 Tax=Thermophilibacter immobilis TaxID=2779519 RepID=A0A7S7M7H5_9ACTN|nr:transporter substrate-binding domain-containing protein [Thermophilibacter immobilis]QOY60189.1 transporter substrate-binding domain-containing protein [Thermophilibacter immobilis]